MKEVAGEGGKPLANIMGSLSHRKEAPEEW